MYIFIPPSILSNSIPFESTCALSQLRMPVSQPYKGRRCIQFIVRSLKMDPGRRQWLQSHSRQRSHHSWNIPGTVLEHSWRRPVVHMTLSLLEPSSVYSPQTNTSTSCQQHCSSVTCSNLSLCFEALDLAGGAVGGATGLWMAAGVSRLVGCWFMTGVFPLVSDLSLVLSLQLIQETSGDAVCTFWSAPFSPSDHITAETLRTHMHAWQPCIHTRQHKYWGQ